MRKKPFLLLKLCLAAILTAVLTAGCGSLKKQETAVIEPVPEPVMAEVDDGNNAVSIVIPTVTPDEASSIVCPTDRNNPVEVIQFAKALSLRGRNKEAAAIYLDASKRFESIGRRFEHDCMKAAVREYWAEGDFAKARELLAQLEEEQDIYMRAAEEENLRKLRKLLAAVEQLKDEE